MVLLGFSVISCDEVTTTTTISGPEEYVHHVQYLMSIDNYALETDGYRIYVDNTTDIIYVGNIRYEDVHWIIKMDQGQLVGYSKSTTGWQKWGIKGLWGDVTEDSIILDMAEKCSGNYSENSTSKYCSVSIPFLDLTQETQDFVNDILPDFHENLSNLVIQMTYDTELGFFSYIKMSFSEIYYVSTSVDIHVQVPIQFAFRYDITDVTFTGQIPTEFTDQDISISLESFLTK